MLMKSELYLSLTCLQVDSPMNLKHPHDLVILMRQETTVNYLKELEVRQWACDMQLKLVVFHGELLYSKKNENELFLKLNSSQFYRNILLSFLTFF